MFNIFKKKQAVTTQPVVDDFLGFAKIPRLYKEIVISEKIDGTNAQIFISEDGHIRAGSRNRWLTPENDNFGFAKWVEANKKDLLKLGAGRHFGEWWGSGIQRTYGVREKYFTLFNAAKWGGDSIGQKPDCCGVVPILAKGDFSEALIDHTLAELKEKGSIVAPGFMKPEGIVIFHRAANQLFKKTFEDAHKG